MDSNAIRVDSSPPLYAPGEGIDAADGHDTSNNKLLDSAHLPFKPYVDGPSLPVLDSGHTASDPEQGSNADMNKSKNIFVRLYRSVEKKHGFAVGLTAFILVILLVLAAVGGIIFGIIVAAERGLTGEDFWTPGHNQLFRICESDSTSRKPFQVHTCNVFRPNYNLNNAPLHAFVESVRPWSTLSASELPGQARRIDPIRLDALLLTYGLKCSKNNTTSTQSITKDDSDDSQIIIGGVGQSFKSRKYAIACNYFTKDGSLSHDFCARYNDGGIKSIGKSRPLSINGIMEKHFGMTCEWVVRDLGFVV